MSGIGPFLWLTGLWVVLWRSVTAATILTGLLVAGLLVLLGHRRRGRDVPHRVHPVAMVRFVVHVLVLLVQSNLTLAKEVLTPTDHTFPGVISVAVPPSSSLVLTLVANSISLTPGTVTLDIDRQPDVLHVHGLYLQDAAATRRQIQRLHELAAAAFVAQPDPEAEVVR